MLRRRHELLGLTLVRLEPPARLPVTLTALAAVGWAALAVWALTSGSWTDQGTAAGIVVVVLGLLNLAALSSAAWWLRRQRRQASLWALLVLLANAALTITDQMGWIDTLYLAAVLAAMIAVFVRTRWYWARAARRERRQARRA